MKRLLPILLVLTCAFLIQTQVQAAAWQPVWKPDATSEFEVGTQLRFVPIIRIRVNM